MSAASKEAAIGNMGSLVVNSLHQGITMMARRYAQALLSRTQWHNAGSTALYIGAVNEKCLFEALNNGIIQKHQRRYQ